MMALMEETSPTPPPSTKITLRQEINFIIGAAVALMVFNLILTLLLTDPLEQEANAASNLLAMIAYTIANATWVTINLKRRGREGKAWRIFTILFGPITISFYLLRYYGLRAFYLIPLYALILVTTILPAVAVEFFILGLSMDGC